MTALHDFAVWLAHSPLNAAVTAQAWIVPEIQVVHIVAIAAVVVSAALINLRALGVIETDRPQRALVRSWLPVIGVALVVLALTGILLIVSEPGRALFRTVFWVKIGVDRRGDGRDRGPRVWRAKVPAGAARAGDRVAAAVAGGDFCGPLDRLCRWMGGGRVVMPLEDIANWLATTPLAIVLTDSTMAVWRGGGGACHGP